MEIDGIVVDVVRKDVKNLRMVVYPPDGRVRVSVPLRVDDESLRRVLVSKRAWIIRQQNKIRTQSGISRRRYISGESHYFQGIPYTLNVVERRGNAKVLIGNNQTIEMYIGARSTVARRGQILYEFYRAHLKKAIPPLIKKWEKIIDVEVAEWGVKKMKTRWGSCNTRARRIWLNLELAKKPPDCLEYVVVHEMVHLLERRHNQRFKSYMDRFLPRWRLLRSELKRSPIGS